MKSVVITLYADLVFSNVRTRPISTGKIQYYSCNLKEYNKQWEIRSNTILRQILRLKNQMGEKKLLFSLQSACKTTRYCLFLIVSRTITHWSEILCKHALYLTHKVHSKRIILSPGVSIHSLTLILRIVTSNTGICSLK